MLLTVEYVDIPSTELGKYEYVNTWIPTPGSCPAWCRNDRCRFGIGHNSAISNHQEASNHWFKLGPYRCSRNVLVPRDGTSLWLGHDLL